MKYINSFLVLIILIFNSCTKVEDINFDDYRFATCIITNDTLSNTFLKVAIPYVDIHDAVKIDSNLTAQLIFNNKIKNFELKTFKYSNDERAFAINYKDLELVANTKYDLKITLADKRIMSASLVLPSLQIDNLNFTYSMINDTIKNFQLTFDDNHNDSAYYLLYLKKPFILQNHVDTSYYYFDSFYFTKSKGSNNLRYTISNYILDDYIPAYPAIPGYLLDYSLFMISPDTYEAKKNQILNQNAHQYGFWNGASPVPIYSNFVEGEGFFGYIFQVH